MSRPDCYKCVHRRKLPHDAHSACNNIYNAKVTGDPHGIRKHWFYWPLNFDPRWLLSCTGFSDNPNEDLAGRNYDSKYAIAAAIALHSNTNLPTPACTPPSLSATGRYRRKICCSMG